MDTNEVAAVVVAVASVLGVILLVVAIVALTRTLNELRAVADEFRRSALPAVTEAHDTVRQANAELERVDGLLVTAESIGATVDSASRLAYLAFSNPMIKAMAFAAGTSRAVRRFRRPE
jgi:hypothetical protein